MKDTRLHNDCDGGQCCACDWDRIEEMQKRLQTERRAWFDPNRAEPLTLEECTRIEIASVVKAMLSEAG